jgi:hypothetical protein
VESREVKEYWQREEEAVINAGRRMVDLLERTGELTPDGLRSLCWLPYSDCTGQIELVCYQPVISAERLKLLLAFNQQVVIQVLPLVSAFEEIYGISPAQMARLYGRKRVLPVLQVFTEDHLSALAKIPSLEPLLQARPPTALRALALPMVSQGVAGVHKLMQDTISLADQDGMHVDYTDYVIMRGLGLQQLADSLNNLERHTFMPWYFQLLAAPLTMGLGATPHFESDDLSAFEGDKVARDIARKHVFPYEVGKFLTRHYKLEFPMNADLEYVERAYRDTAIKKAQNLLAELANAISWDDKSGVSELDEIAPEVFSQANEAARSIESRNRKWRWIPAVLGYGATGAIALKDPLAGLIAGMGYTVLEHKITNLVMPRIAKLRAPPLAIAIWEFERQLRQVRS